MRSNCPFYLTFCINGRLNNDPKTGTRPRKLMATGKKPLQRKGFMNNYLQQSKKVCSAKAIDRKCCTCAQGVISEEFNLNKHVDPPE